MVSNKARTQDAAQNAGFKQIFAPLRKEKKQSSRKPLWKGPEKDGITFSLLCKFLVCRERFRLLVVEGLKDSRDVEFSHALEYGNLWHRAEEAHAAGEDWREAVKALSQRIREHYPTHERALAKWTRLCLIQFPLYCNYWASVSRKQPEGKKKPLLQEYAFKIPYQLSYGRVVVLRGKFDSVFLRSKRVWLQENKTKGEIDEEGITSTISENLQTMLYLIALEYSLKHDRWADGLSKKQGQPKYDIGGVLYNVVRRPLSDRHSIRQRKGESEIAFFKRLSEQIKTNPAHHFKRWDAIISTSDIETFKRECFDPILEQLCDWWDWIRLDPFNPWKDRKPEGNPLTFRNKHHFRFPWGIYNSLASGWRGDYFDYLTKGKQIGVTRVNTLFPELKEEE
jgi:hypothetical protein